MLQIFPVRPSSSYKSPNMVVTEFCILGRIVVCNSQYVGLRITYHDGCPTKQFAIITHENQTKFEIHECSTQLCDMTAGQIVTGIMLPVMRVPMYMSGVFDINQCYISVEKVNCHIYHIPKKVASNNNYVNYVFVWHENSSDHI